MQEILARLNFEVWKQFLENKLIASKLLYVIFLNVPYLDVLLIIHVLKDLGA